MEKREQYIDILRVVACILVVLTHCTPPLSSEAKTSSVYAFVSFICSPSSELFIAISGALLLPVILSTPTFLKKRFLRVFPPLLFWSIVIIIYRYCVGNMPATEIFPTILSIPIKPVLDTYWFFYVISGLYLFAPIISKWMLHVSKKEILGFLFLWGVTLTLGSLSTFFNLSLIRISGNYYFILNSFGGFLGYMILGCYLRKYMTGKRTWKQNVIIPLCILFALLLFAVFCYKHRIITADFFMENLSLPTALLVYSFFMLIKGIEIQNNVINKVIIDIASCSYGIYLIHVFIARELVWNVMNQLDMTTTHASIQIIISLLLSFSISYFIVRLIKLLPFSQYIVG